MKKKKIKNPLIRRIPRELLGDWKKYLVVALFLILTIGFVSGMYVANESMLVAANEGVTKYKLEDGHFELDKKADETLLAAIETGTKADVKQYYFDKAKKELDEKLDEKAYPEAYDKAWDKIVEEIDDKYADAEEKYELNDPDFTEVPVKVYENFFRNEEEDYNNDGEAEGNIRVYAKNDNVDLACLLDGAFPEKADEIAIDRMHADNVGVKVGDEISVSGQRFKVVGLIAYVNYATLHEKSTDMMFDAIKFDVAMVTQEGFNSLHKTVHYSYTWNYVDTPVDEVEQKAKSDDFMKALLTQVVCADKELEDYMPRYANPAINFATDDMGSDKAMGGVLLDILIVIIAFIFAVTISNTIVKEASTIGTLRASGYTRGELVRHYISMPVIVTLLAACVGNILGYTVFKNVVVGMYYNSYSLPTYQTVWNPDAFFKTTIIPVVLMLVVNLIVIIKMMRHTPLQFLRHDLKKTKRKKAMRLPKWSFLSRFRLRIMFQNVTNYLILFVGIWFIGIMLAMAVGMPETLEYYKSNVSDMMFTNYQYVLKSYENEDGDIIITDNKDAEKFNMTSQQHKSDTLDEEISVYGIEDDSRYVKISNLSALKGNEAYISASYADKYSLSVGDTVVLDEKYENKQYEFEVAGIYDHSQALAVFLSNEQYCEIFDMDSDAFTGYLSDSEITDIDEDEIATIVIIKMMRHTPLQFLRHDLKKTKRKKAMRLPKWSFLSRFRLRIMFQNVTNYLILFVGIWFIGIMLAMAVGMPETLEYYKSNVSDMMFTNYQYVLKSYENEDGDIIITDNKDAEKFNMTSQQHKSDTLDEEISVYGIEDDSRYVKISNLSALKGNEAYISASYADKYSLSVGDTVVLDEKYENKQYEFEVAGIYDHSQALAVFLSNEQYCEIFDMDSDAFTGYLSDSEITDIDEDEIATVITEHDITKMCDQLDHSMGSYMTYFQYLCILLSAVLIYLLTKLIIEKNENEISMTKILGYENREIASLYLLSTTIVLVVIDVASVILGVVIMKVVWRIMLFSYSGWYAFRISTMGYVKMFLFILIGYLLVMVLDFRRIKRIPMDQALKNVE